MAAPYPDPLRVAFGPGVTPGKWQRVWRDRRTRGRLDMLPMNQDAALAALTDGTAHMALLRNVSADETWHAIPLYREAPVVLAPKASLVAGLESVSLVELGGLDDLVMLTVDLHGGSGSDAVELVAANVGIAVMPQSVARAHSRKDVVARPLTDGVESSISLVWPTAGAHPLVDEFIGIVRGRTANSSR
ncbi:MAG: LysR family transcriptional regulator [Microbacterium sp.]|nr:LysR family transcriptional regulator [Microbacterium sp.]MBA4345617.1 LysR family transcriptional regulator [Microbacterium sp.]